MFSDIIYDTIFENDEWWHCTGEGSAMLINDAPMMDC